ncbi:MAG: hypothetical protein IJT16_01005 [Lachnospiraceae bacterium]|nr:hypothetical protein [Lachnospiraceae bacterium]
MKEEDLLAQGIDPLNPQALPIVQFFLDQTEPVENTTYIPIRRPTRRR